MLGFGVWEQFPCTHQQFSHRRFLAGRFKVLAGAQSGSDTVFWKGYFFSRREETDDAGVCSCCVFVSFTRLIHLLLMLEIFAYTHVVEVTKELLLAWNACQSIPWNMSPHIWIHFGVPSEFLA